MAISYAEQALIEERFEKGLAAVLSGYYAATQSGQPNQSPFREVFNDIVASLRESPTLHQWEQPSKVTFGIGRYNNWAKVPWVSVLNKKI